MTKEIWEEEFDKEFVKGGQSDHPEALRVKAFIRQVKQAAYIRGIEAVKLEKLEWNELCSPHCAVQAQVKILGISAVLVVERKGQ